MIIKAIPVKIEQGCVIDHIPAKEAYKIAEALELGESDGMTLLRNNCESRKYGNKGIILIEGRELSYREKIIVGIFAHSADINTIVKGVVEKKEKPEIPEKLEDIVYCLNDNCISRDKHFKGVSEVLYNKENREFKCTYCKKNFSPDKVKFKLK